MARLNPSGALPDDITILNSHYFPESLPSSVVNSIGKSKECQKRLGELLESGKKDEKNSGESKQYIAQEKHFSEEEWRVESAENEFSESKSAIYWSCGHSEGFLANRSDFQNNAIINLIKMFVP